MPSAEEFIDYKRERRRLTKMRDQWLWDSEDPESGADRRAQAARIAGFYDADIAALDAQRETSPTDMIPRF
ncbi:MAG: hypothetical protein AAFR11_05550 [Pseudomonadota bacterium]